jgi:2-polyprenyl-6-methoxyphenol hydroxylase-like FAD-dependent oxidoreductase
MDSYDYDLVTVGGGLAGSAIAKTMAGAGAKVLVLERETQFRDRVRGEFLAPWAIRDVDELGILPSLLEAGAIPLPALAGRSLKPRAVQTPDGDVPLSFSHTAVQERLLADAAAAGATVLRGAKVTAVAGGPTATVHFQGPEGPGSVTARLAAGADGRTSLVRKAIGHDEHIHRAARVLAGVRLADVPADPSFGYFIIRDEAGALVSLFPQADGFARAYVFEEGRDAAAFSGKDGYGRFMEALVRLGVPAEAVAGARQAGPLGAFVADDSWVEHPADGALVLAGDAAGISDPTWGHGMALAFHDANVLTRTLLSGDDWRSSVHAYAGERDAYFKTIITIENWLTELQLSAGPDADARRARVMEAWKREPARSEAMDLPGRGPSLDISEETRRWVFAEDATGGGVLSAAPLVQAVRVASGGRAA